MSQKMEVRAQASDWRRVVELLVKCGDSVGTSVMMNPMSPDVAMGPTLSIGFTEAQVLMDDLWGAGLRPTEGTGSAGSLRATEKHLNDMRKIVAKQLEIEI